MSETPKTVSRLASLPGQYLSASTHQLVGDRHAAQVLDCLACIVVLYGEHVILLQYFQHCKELVSSRHDLLYQ